MYAHRGDLVDIFDMTSKFEGILAAGCCGRGQTPDDLLNSILTLRVGQRNGQKWLKRGCFNHFFACGFYCLYGSQGVREGSRGQFWVNLDEIKKVVKKGVF